MYSKADIRGYGLTVLLCILSTVYIVYFQSQGGKDELHQIFHDWKRTTNTFVLRAIRGKLRKGNFLSPPTYFFFFFQRKSSNPHYGLNYFPKVQSYFINCSIAMVKLQTNFTILNFLYPPTHTGKTTQSPFTTLN